MSSAPEKSPEKKIPINGYAQIVEMLKIADPHFRDSLLKRLAARDGQLVDSLKSELKKSGLRL